MADGEMADLRQVGAGEAPGHPAERIVSSSTGRPPRQAEPTQLIKREREREQERETGT
jgi:hypothetical protein